MKTKLSKRTKKAICIYIIALLILYIVVEVLPRVTDIFETTQVLEPGNLTMECETTGYLIKDEYVGVAKDSGSIEYKVDEGTVVKKGYPLVSVKADSKTAEKSPRFTDYTNRLKGYEGLAKSYSAPISGVYSLTIDGYEDYFTFDKMTKIKRSTVEGLSIKPAKLERTSVVEGEPIYKVSGDDAWYILCWVDADDAETYTEGKAVTLKLPDGDVDAEVYKVAKDGSDYRVIFYLDVYYESFCESRVVDMDIVVSDTYGLLVNNGCIIEKNGYQGVYVKNKNGQYKFKRIKVIATDGKQSALTDSTFIDDEGTQVYTVDVYDEVLKHPKSALEDDLKSESSEDK